MSMRNVRPIITKENSVVILRCSWLEYPGNKRLGLISVPILRGVSIPHATMRLNAIQKAMNF